MLRSLVGSEMCIRDRSKLASLRLKLNPPVKSIVVPSGRVKEHESVSLKRPRVPEISCSSVSPNTALGVTKLSILFLNATRPVTGSESNSTVSSFDEAMSSTCDPVESIDPSSSDDPPQELRTNRGKSMLGIRANCFFIVLLQSYLQIHYVMTLFMSNDSTFNWNFVDYKGWLLPLLAESYSSCCLT